MQNRIKELRSEKKMTQVRLSIELEVAQETISAYEKGKHYPSIRSLLIMADMFHASIDYILGISDIRLPVAGNDLQNNEVLVLSLFRSLNSVQKEKAIAFMQGMLE